MKVFILRSTIADGGKDFDRGDTPEIPDADAHILFSTGAARRFVEGKDAAKDTDERSAKGKTKKEADK